ncbi:Clavaminate synthase-like protein [Laetiporus sulphureus 93-53]|uniref:Clavaminate synthase-like protein n=1 Tax=Laetiporus sulphureus 93-53 TaxID=1314785 RepID=A0A165ECH6_9APHY|nr:Clavaminate synthase-like protein [Laetiporus sulphureus 93-53]KZT06729.1 Clavaminate synthase-like protein [Laetiporus sulphureus 93-53]
MDGENVCSYLATPPKYEEFLVSYLIPNNPVIIGSELVSSWPAFKEWVLPGQRINWDYLSKNYGQQTVTVADCSTREFSDQKRQTMLLRDVVALWKAGKGDSLYVKDWHLARAVLGSEEFYSTPEIFQDDWMNDYYSACTDDDFRFVYVGAAGTFTPLHRDVYSSYSWSTNVCGRKRWWLFPPEQTSYLFRKGREEHLETAFDVRDVDPMEVPEFVKAKPIVVEQKEGDTIFIPSGWYHQVENLTACISINHNWCNSVNLPSLYESMCAKVLEVEHALEDVKDMLSENAPEDDDWQQEWVQIVQDVVEKDAGWNWVTFWKMVLHALQIATYNSNESTVAAGHWKPAPPELRPPWSFVKERVQKCYDDFIQRDRREFALIKSLNEVLLAIEAHLA